MGGKGSGKNVPRNPFHGLPENPLKAWPFPWPDPWRQGGRGQQNSHPRGQQLPRRGGQRIQDTPGSSPARPPQLHPVPLAGSRAVRGDESRRPQRNGDFVSRMSFQP
ncbi:unnamed protein product [Rangifer tarandus platyrhynchus]|uniref:Uncharacterized protein n=1 Tax=Rangifer tarandus platyrhynchus TaxID=3082113 RepID=A0ABN8ZAZ9_RANTA|nr:unnamed protein product [Rangifer tarandus platyrhynchus]CAI9689242.1 unnamed protein product [Rangifer tarandus platyrhynchus]